MKRILNICLLLTSLIGYLEWGGEHHTFLFRVEYDLLFKPVHSSDAILHPFIFIPLCGQLLLLFTAFQKTPSRTLTYIGLASLSLIMLFLFIIGLIGGNIKIMASTVPFIATGLLVLRYNNQKRH